MSKPKTLIKTLRKQKRIIRRMNQVNKVRINLSRKKMMNIKKRMKETKVIRRIIIRMPLEKVS